jgi:hypothetical protein
MVWRACFWHEQRAAEYRELLQRELIEFADWDATGWDLGLK